MRKIALSTGLLILMACHHETSTTSGITTDSIHSASGNQGTGKLAKSTGPGEEELAALEEKAQQLAYKTEDPSYSEKEISSTQYIVEEENDDIALRWADGSISNISCAVYLKGIQIPKDNVAKPDSQIA